MVGGGFDNGSSLYWQNATSSSGALNFGSSSSNPASGTPNPIRSDTYWNTSPPSVPAGTYQDAGFAWGGNGRIQWGDSVVTFDNVPDGSTTTFVSTFYNSTYDPPSSPAVAAKVAAIGSNMAQVATGDSGGGVFSNSGTADGAYPEYSSAWKISERIARRRIRPPTPRMAISLLPWICRNTPLRSRTPSIRRRRGPVRPERQALRGTAARPTGRMPPTTLPLRFANLRRQRQRKICRHQSAVQNPLESVDGVAAWNSVARWNAIRRRSIRGCLGLLDHLHQYGQCQRRR